MGDRVTVEPDDDIYRFQNRFLGAPPYTFWVHPRYTAIGVGVAMFILLRLCYRLVGAHMDTIPVFDLIIVICATTVVMKYVDHDKPIDAFAYAVLDTYVVFRLRSRIERDTPTVVDPSLKTLKITRTQL